MKEGKEKCFECDDPARHEHHVIPRVLGGMRTIYLCEACHSKIHGQFLVNHNLLTKKGLQRKKENGEWFGQIPFGFKVEDRRLVEDPEKMKVIQKAKRMNRAGKSTRCIAVSLNLSKSVVHRLLNVNLKSLKHQYVNGLTR